MKNFLKSPTAHVLIFIIKIMIVMFLVNVSFWLMDRASTIAFIGGILLLIGSVGVFLEHLYKKYFIKIKNM